MQATLPVPRSGIHLFADDVLPDPYPPLCELRSAGPVVRLTTYDVWVLPRHEHVRAALADHQRFSSAHGVGYEDRFNARTKGTVPAGEPVRKLDNVIQGLASLPVAVRTDGR
jgi:cytochrome P450